MTMLVSMCWKCISSMSQKWKCYIFGPPVLFAIFVVYFVMFNVHLSPLYVQYRAMRYPATFNISGECPWSRESNPHNYSDEHVKSLKTLARLLEDIYKKHGIMSVVRAGALLYLYRHKVADGDLDIWMIVPKHMTLASAYVKIESVIASDRAYDELRFFHLNGLKTSLFLEYNDWMLIEHVAHVDIVVLHETFINDPSLQAPCLTAMNCDRAPGDTQLAENFHLIRTGVLFQNLCKCRYMDSDLFCVSASGLFLQLKFGDDFMTPFPGKKEDFHPPREMLYERAFSYVRFLLALFPNLKRFGTMSFNF